MSVAVREMRPEDARAFLEIHHAAIRGLAAKDYPCSVIDVWARPVTDAVFERFLTNRDQEIRLMADVDEHPVGIGALVVATAELRACYVSPSAVRRGVGSAIVAYIEHLARDHGLDHLHLESSITAEPFYAALGYVAEDRGEVLIAPDVPMAAVRMRKRLP
jgi:putative acetyltransferase